MSPLQVALVAAGLLVGWWLLAATRPVHRLAPGTDGTDDGGGPARLPVRLSVVIPARDEATTLPRLLGSLAAARPGAHEVIVVDDGSTDATAAEAEAFARVQRLPAAWHANAFAGSTVRKITRGMWAVDLLDDTGLGTYRFEVRDTLGVTGLVVTHSRACALARSGVPISTVSPRTGV